MSNLNTILQNYKFPSGLNIHAIGEHHDRIEFTLPVQIPDDVQEDLSNQDFFDDGFTTVSKKSNKNVFIIKGNLIESQIKTLLFILNNVQYDGNPVCTKSYIAPKDMQKKNKPKISISKFKPKLRMIDESSDDTSKSSESDESDIKDVDDFDDNESSDSEKNITSDDSEVDDAESDDSDAPERESSKKYDQNVTYLQFNSFDLEEKQELIEKLIENTENDSLKKKFVNIDKILKFISKYDSNASPNCFELSIDNPNFQMTSKNGSKSKYLLNASISNKTIKFFDRNSKLGKFLKLFKEFHNVSINLTKKVSTKNFDKLVENIQSLHDGKYKQYNIILTIQETVIEESEFENNTAIKSIILSPSVETIGKHAFYNCMSIEEVTFSDSLKEIGVGAFQKCNSLKEAIIPDSVTKLAVFAFCDCHSLTKVKLSSSLNGISNGAFQYCKKLTDIQIPNTLSFIGENAFRSCYALVQIDIPDSVARINDYAFACCSSLRRIRASKSVKYGNGTFENCSALKTDLNLNKNTRKKQKYTKRKRTPRSQPNSAKGSTDSDDEDSFD